jgi:hypothetical protein
MTHRLVLLVAASSTLLLCAVPAARAAPEPDPVTMGATDQGQLSIDMAGIRTRGGSHRGWRQVQATVELARPLFYAAREITQEVQTQDWDCSKRRYRVVLRVFRTSNGEFVRSERSTGAWFNVPEKGPERRAFETICPAA